ncbi:hypothetical protein BH23ACT5_BH23ACT5_17370 [soil metagenome]
MGENIPALTMNVRRPNEAVSVIDVDGEVTAASESTLTDSFGVASEGAKVVVFNFTDLDYMNSSGIGLLVTVLIRAQRQDQKLMAFGLNDHYRQIFMLTRLDEAIAIFDDEEAVLAAV